MLGLTWAEWLRLLALIATVSPQTMPKHPTDLDYLAGHICTVLDTFVEDLPAVLQEALDASPRLADHPREPMPEHDAEVRVIIVNGGLGLDQVSETRFFRHTRALLGAIAEAGVAKATVANNLNRALVRQMVEALGIGSDLPPEMWAKASFERAGHLRRSHPRIVAEMAGFLRRTKGCSASRRRAGGCWTTRPPGGCTPSCSRPTSAS